MFGTRGYLGISGFGSGASFFASYKCLDWDLRSLETRSKAHCFADEGSSARECRFSVCNV